MGVKEVPMFESRMHIMQYRDHPGSIELWFDGLLQCPETQQITRKVFNEA